MTNLMEEARKGDAKAIAALMNKSTEPKGISVKASREGSCLQVLLEGQTVPAKDATVGFVRQGMENLAIDSIARVKVFGRQVGQDTPVWQDEIVLFAEPEDDEIEAMPMGAIDDDFGDEEDLLPDDDDAFDDELYGDAPESLDESAYFDEDDYGDATPSDVPHLPNESITDFVDDDLDDDEEEDATVVAEEEQKKSSSSSSALLLGLTVLALLLGGFYLYRERPELLASIPVVGDLIPTSGTDDDAAVDGTVPIDEIPVSEEVPPDGAEAVPAEDAASAETPADAPADAPDEPVAEAPTEAPAETAPAEPAAAPPAEVATDDPALDTSTPPATEPFGEAVSAATQAAELTQSAQSPADWEAVAALWERAIEQMGAVPADSPNYAIAQDRLQSYPANLNYARQQAGQ